MINILKTSLSSLSQMNGGVLYLFRSDYFTPFSRFLDQDSPNQSQHFRWASLIRGVSAWWPIPFQLETVLLWTRWKKEWENKGSKTLTWTVQALKSCETTALVKSYIPGETISMFNFNTRVAILAQICVNLAQKHVCKSTWTSRTSMWYFPEYSPKLQVDFVQELPKQYTIGIYDQWMTMQLMSSYSNTDLCALLPYFQCGFKIRWLIPVGNNNAMSCSLLRHSYTLTF